MEREESKIVQTIYQRPERTKFLVQAIIGIITILFSAVQITVHPDQPNNIWVGLICTVLGLFFPNPTLKTTLDGLQEDREDDDDPRGANIGNNTTTTTTHIRSRPSPLVRPRQLKAQPPTQK